nr:uncharacterized protein LOC107452284 [Parasteatoda tepidariorum]XP_015924131.1 uncharacterized protein LOC107452284 [Parasteatoda tepidariorum]XP_015924132.1 uncharacterized protein LOC107452284 [Parasteatoda tepidariorum]XP_042898569.1 uncharacterized protein LOC107452284 [Parasteatoda tepidariorum]
MDRSNKKRIARIGHITSKDKINPMNCLVADIMRKMDASVTDSECFKTFGSSTYRTETDQSNLQIPSAISTHPNIAPQQQKKFLPTKRHPLMEKAQKSKNYIKHNRSIPKPRAHLGGLEDPVQSKRKIDVKRNFSSTHLEEKRKPSDISTKSQHSKSNNTNIAHSNKRVSGISSKSPILSSDSELESFTQAQKLDTDSEFESFIQAQKLDTDSESEFESFIQAQKLDTEWGEQNSTKTKKKSKLTNDGRKRKKLSKKKYTKNKRMKSVELENEDNNSLPSPSISSKITTTNRLTLPETSDSSVYSADESKSTNSLFEAEKTSSVPSFEKENRIESCRQIDTDSSMCTVRIERNPLLDEVFELHPPLKDIKNYEFSSQPEESKKIDLTECTEKTAVESDDDCLIVCELPNSNNHFDICATEGVNTVSDIQILNVISMGQNEKAIDMNEENTDSATQSTSLGENSRGDNLESSKGVIDQGSNFSTLTDETFITELNDTNFSANITEDRFQVVTDCNSNEKSCPPVSSNILDAFNKIDLKQVLLLASNADNKSSSEIKLFDSLPCSSSCTDLPSKNPEIITESHWLNLKKAVNMNNCSTNELLPAVVEQLKDGRVDFNHLRSENITKCIDNVRAPSKEPAIVSDCNISAASLKEIITVAEQLTRARGRNILPDKDTRGFQLKTDSYEDPCDELDDFVTASIREFWPKESPQNSSKLLHIYSQVLQEYNKIKNSEKSITYSLKILQESKEAKKKHLETVLKHLMKCDPCFYTTAKSSQDTVVYNDETSSVKNTETEDISSYQIKSCVNCGSKATILCDNCKKVYFCSTECGVFYWENGHYKTCEGLKD